MRLSDFDYPLPAELIAQTPPAARSASRLLVVDPPASVSAAPAGATVLEDRQFADLPGLLSAGDLLVFNDTRVIRARLHGRRETGGRVEVLVERVLGHDQALVHLKASHKPAPGGRLLFDHGVTATLVERREALFVLRFEGADGVLAVLDAQGELPLPPYIGREPQVADETRYQTVFARAPGAVAASTAGLHFDEALLAALAARGVERAFLTLHIGAGTFQPVRTENLSQHRMHSEWWSLPQATVDAIAATRSRGGRVVAVGTTVMRTLETAARLAGSDSPRAGSGETDLFITPGFEFRVIDRMITNFHLPKSTLLMLVSAFAGVGPIRAAYAHAVEQRYRFFSYGDAMLLTRARPGA